MQSLEGRVAIVTGGTGLIGRAIVEELARLKAAVCVGYLKAEDTAKRLVEELGALTPGKCSLRRLDVTRDQECAEGIAAVAQEYGRVDILVHAAGVAKPKLLSLSSEEDVRLQFSENTFGAISCLRSVLPYMVKQGSGRVVLVGSRATQGAAGMSLYAASKSALVGLVRSAAKEYAKHGITLNVVSPARVEGGPGTTGPAGQKALADYPMNRFVKATEVAALIAFLSSDAAGAITGQDVFITAGA